LEADKLKVNTLVHIVFFETACFVLKFCKPPVIEVLLSVGGKSINK
jgi:hypothetical protein